MATQCSCGHSCGDHGRTPPVPPGAEYDPACTAAGCSCPLFAPPPFDSTRDDTGRPGVYVQVNQPLSRGLPSGHAMKICFRCGAALDVAIAERHDCGLRGEPVTTGIARFTHELDANGDSVPIADRDAKPELAPDLVAMLAQAATSPALRAEAVIALWRSWGEEPTAENRYRAAYDPATGERIYVRISDSQTLTVEEQRWLADEAKEGKLGRTFYEERFRAIIERLLSATREVVICAAIRLPDGRVFRGHRHPHCRDVARAAIVAEGREWFPHLGRDQGFVTSRNRYVDRDEGLRLQLAAGIESVAPGGYRGQLFSEDLY